MTFSSFPIDPNAILVADASVVINLNATGRAEDIIQAHPGSIVLTDAAFAELAAGANKGHNDHEQVQVLVDSGAMRQVSLGESGLRVYASLIEGSALKTLDDGEAATIGYAHEVGGVAIIDERKARTICEKAFPGLSIASTVDMLTHSLVEEALGRQGQIKAVTNALRGARMRVPPHQVELVVDLIGEEVAATCNSLPRAARMAR